MVICGDTSFLFSLYGNDVHSERAVEWIRDCREPLYLSRLNSFELGNAIRFAAYRGVISRKLAKRYWANFETGIQAGRLIVMQANLGRIIEEAERISGTYTSDHGHRSFDILHVATAVVLKSEVFLSFDKNQGALAKRLGLKTPLS